MAKASDHTADEHCDVDPATDTCRDCGVDHGDACGQAMAKVVDEIASLELLADMAADLEQAGRVAYCKRRIKKLRAQLAATAHAAIRGAA